MGTHQPPVGRHHIHIGDEGLVDFGRRLIVGPAEGVAYLVGIDGDMVDPAPVDPDVPEDLVLAGIERSLESQSGNSPTQGTPHKGVVPFHPPHMPAPVIAATQDG